MARTATNTRNATKRMAAILSPKKKEAVKKMQEGGKKTQFGQNGRVGGRKPAVIEMKAKEFVLSVIGGAKGVEELVQKIYQQAMKGSFYHQELLLNYILGKPTDRVQIEAVNGSLANVGAPIIKIIASDLRLERLNKDIEDKDKTTPAERIAEAEEVLNKHINKEEDI